MNLFIYRINILSTEQDNQIPDAQIKSQFQLKSINAASAISCFSYMCSALKKEVEDVEYFITKCKSFHAKYKIGGQGEQHENKCKFTFAYRIENSDY